MNEKSLLEDFKNKTWNYLMVSGSPLGNTSFLLSFVKNIILGEKTKEGAVFDRLLDEQVKILYLRPEEITPGDKLSKSLLKDVEGLSQIESIFTEDVFEYRNILRTLQNRQYTHLIVDEVRKKYDDNRLEKFTEILSFCAQSNVKVLVSTTDNKTQKLDYNYYSADIVLSVNSLILQNIYFIEMEDNKKNEFKKYSLTMK